MKSLSTLTGYGFATLALLMAAAVWMLPAPSLPDLRRAPLPAQTGPEATQLDLAAVTERPLFDRSRKPLEVAPAPAPQAPKPALVTLSLHGVIGNAEGGLTALMRQSNSDELFARRVGERLGNVTIESVEGKEVVLRYASGRTETLILGTE